MTMSDKKSKIRVKGRTQDNVRVKKCKTEKTYSRQCLSKRI